MKTGLNMKNQMLFAGDVIARLNDMKPLVAEENAEHFDKTKSRNKSYCIRWGRNAQRSEDARVYDEYINALVVKMNMQERANEQSAGVPWWAVGMLTIVGALIGVAVGIGIMLM